MRSETFFYRGIELSCISNLVWGPAIVFLHGNSLSSESFIHQFHDSTLQDFRLIAIDFPGHGNSPRTKNAQDVYNLFSFRDLVLHVIHHLKVENFILAGHSLGGHVAIECLPLLNGCRGIMIWSAPPVQIPLNMAEIFLTNPSLGLLFKKDLTELEIKQLASVLVDEKHIQHVIKMIRQSDPAFREFLPASLANNFVSNEYKLIAESPIPVAILHGEKDSLVNRDYYSRLNIPKIWKKKVFRIAGATHTPQLESSDEFNKLLLEFCSEVL